MYKIRPFTSADYEAYALISRLSVRNSAATASEIEFDDRVKEERCYLQRFIAEVNGYPAASATVSQPSDMYHPRKFSVQIKVIPEYRNHGIGSAMYDVAMRDVTKLDPISIAVRVQEDNWSAVRFAEKRGFVEVMREWISILDVEGCDLSSVDDPTLKLAAEGIEIKPLSALTSDSEWDIKLHELDSVTSMDCPSPDEYTPLSLESFRAQVLEFPTFDPDCVFLAVDDGLYVGMSSLWRRGSDGDLDTGFTGVLSEYRKRGVAMALKLAAVRYAKVKGHAKIYTCNAVQNRSMLAINEALGFTKDPADVSMRLTISKEPNE